jgi:hypothetical protein
MMTLCRQYHWQFMLVLQDDCLPSVWEEVQGLGQLEGNNHLHQNWGNRQQDFQWVNGIEYGWGEGERRKLILHVVICESKGKSWLGKTTQEVPKGASEGTGKPLQKLGPATRNRGFRPPQQALATVSQQDASALLVESMS